MKKKFLIFNYREIYHESGEFCFKVALDENRFQQGSIQSDFTLHDSAGTKMKTWVRPWGNKLNCYFVIDEQTLDGIATGQVTVIDKVGNQHKERVSFWVIK